MSRPRGNVWAGGRVWRAFAQLTRDLKVEITTLLSWFWGRN